MRVGVVKQDTVGTNGGEGGWGGGGEGLGLEGEGEEVNGWVTAHKVTVWWRSEERRVGKGCRSRGSPYH